MERPIFGGACGRREICIIKSVGLACSVNEIYHFCFILLSIRGQIPCTRPRGAYIQRGDLTEGFLHYDVGGLYMEGLIFGIFTVFHLNGHTIGFHAQAQQLKPSYKMSFTVRVQGVTLATSLYCLRYLTSHGRLVLSPRELDAFLAQALSPQLTTECNASNLREIKLQRVDSRAVQLASIFMSGVQAAIFANDACAVPIPWELVCPWNYFDGKLFHSKYLLACQNATLADLCDGKVSL